MARSIRHTSHVGDGGEEVRCELVVAGRDTPEVLEPAESVLDEVAFLVARAVVADGRLSRSTARDDRHGPDAADRAPQGFGVIALVGEDVPYSDGALEKRRSSAYVGDVARRERDRVGASDDIGERVDSGGLAAARGTDRLRPRPPFPPNAARWALM